MRFECRQETIPEHSSFQYAACELLLTEGGFFKEITTILQLRLEALPRLHRAPGALTPTYFGTPVLEC